MFFCFCVSLRVTFQMNNFSTVNWNHLKFEAYINDNVVNILKKLYNLTASGRNDVTYNFVRVVWGKVMVEVVEKSKKTEMAFDWDGMWSEDSWSSALSNALSFFARNWLFVKRQLNEVEWWNSFSWNFDDEIRIKLFRSLRAQLL